VNHHRFAGFILLALLPPSSFAAHCAAGVCKKKKKNGRRDFGASKALRRKGDGAMSRRSIPAL